MNYETLETEIVTRLSFMNTADILVEKLPELEADRSKPLPTKAKITVIYAGSEYGNSMSTSQVSQEEKLFIQILIESTFLRGAIGIYNLTSVIKSALIGFRPTFCKAIQVTKHHTIGGEESSKINNMWNYNLIFQTTAFDIENFIEDPYVLLKKITLIDQPDGEVTIIE